MTRAAWMMVGALICAATPIASCATIAGTSYSTARTPIDRAAAAFERIRIVAGIASLLLPSAQAADLRGWLAEADRALAAARLARDVEQLRHLQDLDRAAAAITARVPR